MSKAAEKMARRLYEQARADYPFAIPAFDRLSPMMRRIWVTAVSVYLKYRRGKE